MAYNTEELNVKEGLEYSMDNVDFYKDILETYMEETVDQVKQMDLYLASENMLEYATLVHAVKSGSRLIGAMKLGDEAFDLEQKSKAGDVEYIRSHHDALKAHIDVVFEAIKGYMAES
ncbi:Hpt domain-containing protein [Lachnospiraceae bacterium XBB2008]|nr:Hpt domain-containing protein [Lachnospiraceae bacterium XBB2008]